MPIKMPKRRVALLVALTLGAYARAPFGGFVWDDHKVLEHGRLVGSLANLPKVWAHDTMFNSDGGAFEAAATVDTYRPLTMTTFFAEVALFGRRPGPLHAGSVAVHLGCVLLLFAIGRRLGASDTAALLGAALFAVHPAISEGVHWVNGLSDPLATFFFLLAVAAWLRGWTVAVAVCAAAATLSKETAFMLFPTVALLWPVRQSAASRAIAPWVAGAAAGLVLRLLALKRAAVAAGGGQVGYALRRLPAVWLDGLRSLLLPSGGAPPSLFERYRQVGLSWTALALAVVALGTALAAWRRRRGEVLLPWAWAAFILTLAPVALLTSDEGWFGWGRYLYPAAPMVCLAAAAALVDGAPPRLRPNLRRIVAYGAVLLLVLSAGQTLLLASTWRDDRALATALVEDHPELSVGWSELSAVELEAGQPARALELAEEAIRRAPDNGRAWSRAASALMQLGRRAEAFEAARRARVLRPADNNARYIAALAELAAGRQAEAARLLVEAVRVEPDQMGPWQTLAQAVGRLGAGSELGRTVGELAAEPRYAAVAARLVALIGR
jgi:tetratricopeptide (TPR) repeat protein